MKKVIIALVILSITTLASAKEVTLEFYLRAFNNVDGYTIIGVDVHSDKIYLIAHTSEETGNIVLWDDEVSSNDLPSNDIFKKLMSTGRPIEVYACSPETRKNVSIPNVDLTPVFDKGLISFRTPQLKESTPLGDVYTIKMFQ